MQEKLAALRLYARELRRRLMAVPTAVLLLRLDTGLRGAEHGARHSAFASRQPGGPAGAKAEERRTASPLHLLQAVAEGGAGEAEDP